ncbi:MAG: zinc ribbon domain-containing protein [Isosphaeraceae bacterium]|nr:zinc ribbon domain-containing protein [Isosphaeraceae bacterium]
MRDRDDEFDLEESDELHDDEAAVLLPCPHCLGTIVEETPRCPHCGEWLSEETPATRPPWWIVMGVMVCLLVVLRWIVR